MTTLALAALALAAGAAAGARWTARQYRWRRTVRRSALDSWQRRHAHRHPSAVSVRRINHRRRRPRMLALGLAPVLAVVALVAGCDWSRNPRYDACQWLDAAAGSDVKWFPDGGYERGGRCKIIAGALSLRTKDECARVIRSRGTVEWYQPPLRPGQAENYCYIH